MEKRRKSAQAQKTARKRWENELKRQGIEYSPYKTHKKTKKRKEFEFIKLPSEFCIYSHKNKKNFKKVLRVIDAIDRIKNTKVLLDFSEVTHLKVAAMLVLYAAVEKSIMGGCRYKIAACSHSYIVNMTLKKSGFIRLCRNNEFQPSFDKEYMPVVSGIEGQYRDEIVDFIQSKIYKDKMSAMTESVYGGAIQEAINNVSYHAYPELENSKKRWWVKCDLTGDQLFLAIYDKGVGIPETVAKNKWYRDSLQLYDPKLFDKIVGELKIEGININHDELSKLIGKIPDEIKIAVSMVGDVSGTKLSKHGQGSKSIKALVNKNNLGKLWIYSKEGLYKLESNKAKTYKLPAALEGTLIQWNIKVEYDKTEENRYC